MVLLRERKLIKGVCEKEVNSSPHDTSLSPTHHRPGIPCPEDRDSVLRSHHEKGGMACTPGNGKMGVTDKNSIKYTKIRPI